MQNFGYTHNSPTMYILKWDNRDKLVIINRLSFARRKVFVQSID